MGKKKAQNGTPASSTPQKTPEVKKEVEEVSVSPLKSSLDKLKLNVQKMDEILQKSEVKVEPATNGVAEGAYDDKKNMTAEEKKQQRAAKAAEKKARAEAAKAKKENEQAAPKAPAKKSEKDENTTPESKPAAVKTSLKKQKGPENTKSDPKGVKFDLTPMVKSPSEENLEKSIKSAAEQASHAIIDGSSVAHVHPAFLNLAYRCEEGLINELDQLCEEFLMSFKEYLSTWISERGTSDEAVLSKDLELAIQPQFAHLTSNGRWPLPFALGNIVRQLKNEIAKIGNIDPHRGVITAKDLVDWIDDYREINFGLAYKTIWQHIQPKLKPNMKILTYEWSPIVNHILLNSADIGIKYCFVDPEINGRGMRHVEAAINNNMICQYTDLKSIGSAMRDCSMVLIGCSAILSNGNVAAPKGALQLALTAKLFNVPLLIVAQSFKFVDKVQTYGRMSLLDRDQVELVPSDLVTAVVTDMRILHPSSAPAVLKAKALDLE